MKTVLPAVVSAFLLASCSPPPATVAPAKEAASQPEVTYEGRPVSVWLQCLADRDPATHDKADMVLRIHLGREAIPGLCKMLGSADAHTQISAVSVLHSVHHHDPDRVRPAIKKFLASMSADDPNRKGVEKLARELGD